MNNCILSGRLTRDPYKKDSGAHFTLAVDHDYKDKDGSRGVDFLPISVFGKSADQVCKYLAKGDEINVLAKASSYTNASGAYKISFKLQKFEFVKVKYFDSNAADTTDELAPEEPESTAAENAPCTSDQDDVNE